ncbi:MAG: hypothetical protein ACRD29_11365 [Acidimicrobiales bacterium]
MSREFYPREFTDRSRSVLHRVRDAVPDAVLIGGWGTWVRIGGAMSHDIDLIVTRPQLAVITTMVGDASESRHLGGRKWRATLEGIHLDLYVPHLSRLGEHLQLRTERLVERRERVDRWTVLDVPGHLATKLAALVDRPDSLPGEKDRQEILALLDLGVNVAEAVGALHHASARTPQEVSELIGQAVVFLADLPLDHARRRWLRQLAAEWHRESQPLTGGPYPRSPASPGRPPAARRHGTGLGR